MAVLLHTHVLLRQVGILFFLLGVLAGRIPGPALSGMCLLLLCFLGSQRWKHILFCLLACSLCGFLYYEIRLPKAPILPEWLYEAVYPVNAENENLPAPYVFISGKITQAKQTQPGRWQSVLTEVQQVPPTEFNRLKNSQQPESALINSSSIENSNFSTNGQAYKGNLLWNWYNATETLVPGQRIIAQVRMSPIRSLGNPDSWDTEQYWHDQNIWIRSWSNPNNAVFIINDNISFLNKTRLTLKERFIAALSQEQSSVQAATKNIVSPSAALLPALIFGDRSFIDPENLALINKSTLAHSLALSGLHLGYALALGYMAAYLLGALMPRCWIFMPKQQIRLLLGLPFAILYLWLGDAPLSLLRATCMFLVWLALLFLKRPKILFDGLLLAVFGLVLFQPLYLFDLRLQLSALSVATIAAILPGIRNINASLSKCFTSHKQKSENTSALLSFTKPFLLRIMRGTIAILCISACAQLALYPLLANTFGTIGLWFPLNVLWLPVLGAIVMPFAFLGLLLAGLNWPTLAQAALQVATYPCEWLLLLLHYLESQDLLLAPATLRPHWTLGIGYWLLLLFLPLACHSYYHRFKAQPWQSPQDTTLPESKTHKGQKLLSIMQSHLYGVMTGIGLVLSCTSLLFIGNIPPGVTLRVLDVGQGQAVLVQWTQNNNKGNVLVDAGNTFATGFSMGQAVVVPSLSANVWPKLNWAIVSHPDADHLGGMIYVLETVPVTRYGMSPVGMDTTLQQQADILLNKKNIQKQVLVAEDIIQLTRHLQLEVLWPDPTLITSATTPNNGSVVVRLLWQDTPLALICGDIEKSSMQALLANTPDKLTAPALVIPHHGAKSSLLPQFYLAVQPEVACISCGFRNQWGFPSPAVIEALQKQNTPTYSTATHGQISIHWQQPGKTGEITTFRQIPPLRFNPTQSEP